MNNASNTVAGLAIVVFLTACSLWDPDYEPNPDDQLRGLLHGLSDPESSADAAFVERTRFAIVQLATRFPGHVPSKVAAAAIQIERGEPQRAQGLLDRALTLDATHVEARVLRVRMAVSDGNLELARSLVDDGLNLRPDAFKLQESSAWISQLSGEHVEALTALSKAEALGAPPWRVAYHRGLIEEQRGQWRAAEQHYRRALDANGACEQARRRLTGLSVRVP